MEKTKVAILKCDSYDPNNVYTSLKKGLELLGGLDHLFSKDEKILLKPNFLAAKKPSEVVTTHPSIFEGIVKLLNEEDFNNLTYGDSPATGSVKTAARASGFEEIANKYNVPLGDFDHGQSVSFPEGNISKSFDFANGVLEADSIISLSKMKSHALTRLTGAVKNQFGLIYGLNKAGYHSKFPDIIDFSKALIDINRWAKPKLFIMDGIVAMEGNGPKNGDPVPMNVILMSTDPIALDITFAKLVDIDPFYVATNKAAKEVDYGCYDINNIEFVGDPLEDFINKDFKVERVPAKGEAAGLGRLKYIRNFITRRPVVEKEKCIQCGVCEKHCPQEPKAVILKDKKSYPKYYYNRCIRCFCCQELCPNKAIKVKTPLIGKLLFYK